MALWVNFRADLGEIRVLYPEVGHCWLIHKNILGFSGSFGDCIGYVVNTLSHCLGD